MLKFRILPFYYIINQYYPLIILESKEYGLTRVS